MTPRTETQDGFSHYIPWLTAKDDATGLQQTVCGAWISPHRHDVIPSCPQCEAWFQALSAPTKKASAA